jgi:hypothetical protein
MSLTKPTTYTGKRKHKVLSLQDKLKLMAKLENGASVVSVCAEFGIAKQTVSSGWLFRFCKCHNVVNRKMCGESLSADTAAVEPFRKAIDDIVKEESLDLSRVYNADETGLFWGALHENTEVCNSIKNALRRKISKECVSALLCAHTDGSGMLKLCSSTRVNKLTQLKTSFSSCMFITTIQKVHGILETSLQIAFIIVQCQK